ncbi:MAG: hypothetical protein Q6363_002015 [Candidatus Njordarchaeota archaeon]
MNGAIKCPKCGKEGKLEDFICAISFSQELLLGGNKKAIVSMNHDDNDVHICVDYGCLYWEFGDILNATVSCRCPKCGHRFLLSDDEIDISVSSI